MNDLSLVTAGALSSLFLEGIKIVLRRWILKNPDYDFDPKFYAFIIPVLNAVMPFALLALGVVTDAPILKLTSAMDVAKFVILVAVNSLISVVINTTAIKPVKEYSEYIKFTK